MLGQAGIILNVRDQKIGHGFNLIRFRQIAIYNSPASHCQGIGLGTETAFQ
jgi:hypothetical protein